MAYLANDLVTRAWYLSGIVARNLETVSGDQATDGLFLLNTLLDFKATDESLIPYYTRYNFNLVQGQEVYTIANLFAVETMTFTLNTVRYSMMQVSRDVYFGSARANGIQSLPFNYHVERELDGSKIYVYYLPNQTYVAEILGKFGLTNVTQFQDMSLVYDMFYMEYLRYALAQMMCDEYDIQFAPNKLMKLKEYEKKLMYVSPPDLSMKKLSTMQHGNSLNYAQVNLGRGWTPN